MPPVEDTPDPLGTFALVLGMVALVTSPLTFGAVPGTAAIALGGIACGRARRQAAPPPRSGIGGIALGVLSLLIPVTLLLTGISFYS